MCDTQALVQAAWEDVEAQFKRSEIPNEATLQAALYAALKGQFPEKARVLCGAAAKLKDGRRRHPDLMVVLDRHVVAAIEVKLAARSGKGRPVFENDVEKLHELSEGEASLAFEPVWLDEVSSQQLGRFSADTYCVFACIGRYDAKGVCEASVRSKCAPKVPRNFKVLSLVPRTGPWANPSAA